jgi:hypothetical protein
MPFFSTVTKKCVISSKQVNNKYLKRNIKCMFIISNNRANVKIWIKCLLVKGPMSFPFEKGLSKKFTKILERSAQDT